VGSIAGGAVGEVRARAGDHRDAPLIPDFLWRWVGLVIVVLSAVVVGFALLTTGDTGARRFERPIIDQLRYSSVPTALWRFGLALGAPWFFAAVVLALALWASVRRSWPALIACATVPGAVILVEQILKPIVDRRYYHFDSTLYYPSGTAAGVAAWTTLTWLLAVPMLKRPALRLALAIALFGLTALTAMSVVAMDKHLPLDAVGGAACGMGVVLACAAIIDLVTHAHGRCQSPRARRSETTISAPAAVSSANIATKNPAGPGD
jgi:membrane-associated phospholipid phosphatase